MSFRRQSEDTSNECTIERLSLRQLIEIGTLANSAFTEFAKERTITVQELKEVLEDVTYIGDDPYISMHKGKLVSLYPILHSTYLSESFIFVQSTKSQNEDIWISKTSNSPEGVTSLKNLSNRTIHFYNCKFGHLPGGLLTSIALLGRQTGANVNVTSNTVAVNIETYDDIELDGVLTYVKPEERGTKGTPTEKSVQFQYSYKTNKVFVCFDCQYTRNKQQINDTTTANEELSDAYLVELKNYRPYGP